MTLPIEVCSNCRCRCEVTHIRGKPLCPGHTTHRLLGVEIERLLAIVSLIDELRGPGSDYITLHCQDLPCQNNPPSEAVDVVADWTGFEEKWFRGATLQDALQAAVEAKRAAEAAKGE